MIIYKASNKINGKVYIGQTRTSLELRKVKHLRLAHNGGTTHFCQAIRKYGDDAFQFEIICRAYSKEELNRLETFYIQQYDSIHSGYNMVDGGDSNVMDIISVKEHHKQVMSSDIVRTKISNTMKQKIKNGELFTPEHRKKLSEAAKQRVYPKTSEPSISKTNKLMLKRGDTRSVGCYCIDELGQKHEFHSYRDAGKWWFNNYKPFPYSECVYQRKIKQCIELGYCYYTPGGCNRSATIKIDNIKWYKGGDFDAKKVTDKNTVCADVE